MRTYEELLETKIADMTGAEFLLLQKKQFKVKEESDSMSAQEVINTIRDTILAYFKIDGFNTKRCILKADRMALSLCCGLMSNYGFSHVAIGRAFDKSASFATIHMGNYKRFIEAYPEYRKYRKEIVKLLDQKGLDGFYLR